LERAALLAGAGVASIAVDDLAVVILVVRAGQRKVRVVAVEAVAEIGRHVDVLLAGHVAPLALVVLPLALGVLLVDVCGLVLVAIHALLAVEALPLRRRAAGVARAARLLVLEPEREPRLLVVIE